MRRGDVLTGPAVADLTGPPDFGPYRVGELVGQGGMGTVHRAYDTVNRRVVALKRLPGTGVDAEFVARFRREARVAAGLRHPHVVPVHAFGEIDGQLYLDMALVDGTDLRRLLGTEVVGPTRVLAVLAQIADALDAAHAAGLVHRDVKPSNILLGPDDHAYLADFGIARSMSSESTDLTRSGALLGTLDYLAPERLSSAPTDGRADQYSLACVLYECLTGRLPHPTEEPAAKLAGHLLRPPTAPSVLHPTLAPAVDPVLLRGMAKEPGRRFSSCADLLEAAGSALTAHDGGRHAATAATDRDQAYLIAAIVRATAERHPPTPGGPVVCPYPGLRGFEAADADWFHGRDQVVADLLVRLTEQLDGGEPVVLVGASGSGKSSVLRAGVGRALAAGQPPGSAWPQVVVTPGADPVGALAAALAPVVGTDEQVLARAIRHTPTELGRWCHAAGRLVIVVDQFEELFTLGAPAADRLAVATALANAGPALVLLAVRADLVEPCIGLAPLRPALAAPVLLGPLNRDELRLAVLAPARDAGLRVETGLAERVLADFGAFGEAGHDPGALPRLAHALRETWRHGDGTALTLAAYRSAGGIEGAVARTAEQFYAGLDQDGRRIAQRVLLRLVVVLDDGVVARRRAERPELVEGGAQVLDGLIASRLVTVDEKGAQLSHEALLTAWPRLRAWVDADREGIAQHTRFAAAARAWDRTGRQDDDLFRGVRLGAVTQWLESAADRVRLQPVEREFLDRSNAVEQSGAVALRRRTRRLRALVAALSVLLLVASGAVAVASALRERAVQAGQVSLARQLAAESRTMTNVDPHRAALLALGSWRAAQTVESRSAVVVAADAQYRGSVQAGADGSVSAIAAGADGRVAATGSRDGTLRLWDVPSHREIGRLGPEQGWYRSVSMSADGRLLVAANPTTGTVTLWSVPDRRLLFTEPGKADDAAIAPDGRSFAVSSGAARVVVRDTARYTELAAFRSSQPFRMAFSPDSTLLAVASGNAVELHRAGSGARVGVLGHPDRVTTVGFDPGGGRLASTGADGTVRIWDVAAAAPVRTLRPSEGNAFTAAYADDRTLIVGNAGPGVEVWDPTNGRRQWRVPSRTYGTSAVAVTAGGRIVLGGGLSGELTLWDRGDAIGFSDRAVSRLAPQPGGPLLATVAGDGTGWLWERGSGVRRPIGDGGQVEAAFSPDGTRLVTVAERGEVQVRAVADGARLATYSRPELVPVGLAVSPDGSTVAVAVRPRVRGVGVNGVLLLRASDLAPLVEHPTGPADGEDRPTGIAFSPDGRSVAVPLESGRVAAFAPSGGSPAPGPWTQHPGFARGVAFSPDGSMLATGADGVVRLWSVPDFRAVGELPVGQAVRSVAFSPDGAALAVAGLHQQLQLWDVPGRQPLLQLDQTDTAVNDVRFDHDGRLLSGYADGWVSTWDVDPGRAAERLCGVLGPEPVADQWRALGPDFGDPPGCPG